MEDMTASDIENKRSDSETILGFTKQEIKNMFTKAWKDLEEEKLKKQEQDLLACCEIEDEEDHFEDAKNGQFHKKVKLISRIFILLNLIVENI